MTNESLPDVNWPPGWGPDRCDSFVSHRRRLTAPASIVFARLTAVSTWPAWLRGVERTEVTDDIVVGSRFVVVATPHRMDGIVGEVVRPGRFGWAAVSAELSFYQSWLLVDRPGNGTLVTFQEAARGSAALLRSPGRFELTREWIDALKATTDDV
ncbi:SRPBCC family protein [Actinoplanes sp. HUAS TT8]|uniref:SRPBCC family protein n=1 Tax=Actinoplanes sp. HUAS TT8 TaxID=3447453 RepID=UPI003F51DCB2